MLPHGDKCLKLLAPAMTREPPVTKACTRAHLSAVNVRYSLLGGGEPVHSAADIRNVCVTATQLTHPVLQRLWAKIGERHAA